MTSGAPGGARRSAPTGGGLLEMPVRNRHQDTRRTVSLGLPPCSHVGGRDGVDHPSAPSPGAPTLQWAHDVLVHRRCKDSARLRPPHDGQRPDTGMASALPAGTAVAEARRRMTGRPRSGGIRLLPVRRVILRKRGLALLTAALAATGCTTTASTGENRDGGLF